MRNAALLTAAAILGSSLIMSSRSLDPKITVQVPSQVTITHVVVAGEQVVRVTGIPSLGMIVPNSIRVQVDASMPPLVLETP